MEVRQLQIFRALAEELNFTRTAERVHTVQSNVTTQIKALEQERGVPLFDRLGRKVVLTDAGRRFLPFAEKALDAMEHGQRAVACGSEPSGPLKIGAPESIVTYRLPPVLNVFRKRFPHVEIIFSAATPELSMRSRPDRSTMTRLGLVASSRSISSPSWGAVFISSEPRTVSVAS